MIAPMTSVQTSVSVQKKVNEIIDAFNVGAGGGVVVINEGIYWDTFPWENATYYLPAEYASQSEYGPDFLLGHGTADALIKSYVVPDVLVYLEVMDLANLMYRGYATWRADYGWSGWNVEYL